MLDLEVHCAINVVPDCTDIMDRWVTEFDPWVDRLAEAQFGEVLEEVMVHIFDFISVGLGPRCLHQSNILSRDINFLVSQTSLDDTVH